MSLRDLHPDKILGNKSKMKVPLVSTDYLTMFYYRQNLEFKAKTMRICFSRRKLEKEAERIKVWLENNKDINYQK